MLLLWILVGIALLAVELQTGAFFAVFLGLGCFAAAVGTAMELEVWIQVAAFVVVTLLGTIIVRPTIVRYFQRRSAPIIAAGAAGLIGQPALTLDEVGDEHHSGHAQLGGEHWLAFTDGPVALPANTRVVVVDVRGTTLVVRPTAAAESTPHK